MKSIKLSAKSLYLTPSAVSQTLSKLEEGIQTQLFIRSGKQLIPTFKAKTLFDSTRGFIHDMNSLFDELSPESINGTIRIGAPFIFGNGKLIDALEVFRKTYPRVDVCVTVSNTTKLIDELKLGTIDIGFLDELPDPSAKQGIISEPLLKEELILCGLSKLVPSTLRKETIRLTDLLKLPHITNHSGIEGVRKWYLHHFKRIPKLNVSISINHPEGISIMVKKGWGLSVLPKQFIEKDIQSGKVVVIQGPRPVLSNTISISQLGARLPDLAQKKFVTEMKRYFQTRNSPSICA